MTNKNYELLGSGAGIIIYGSNRAGLISALPNRTTTLAPWRKLINGGS